MGRVGWGWTGYVMEALGQPDASRVDRRAEVLAPPAGVRGSRCPTTTLRSPRLGSRGPHPPRPDPGRPRRATTRPGRLRRGRHRPLSGRGGDQRRPASGPGRSRTGTGKTLGYLAPASVWAEKNKGPVWISTFTRHLQRQIEAEVARIWPDPTSGAAMSVVRKGRENYLCLLNLEEAVNNAASGFLQNQLIRSALSPVWAAVTEDGRHPWWRPARLVGRTARRRLHRDSG